MYPLSSIGIEDKEETLLIFKIRHNCRNRKKTEEFFILPAIITNQNKNFLCV